MSGFFKKILLFDKKKKKNRKQTKQPKYLK